MITFLKNHGKEILEKERYKYEPIKKETETKLENNEYLQLKNELKELKIMNNKLKLNTKEEWFDKYKKYKDKYKDTKRKLKETKREMKQIKVELQETNLKLSILEEEIKKLKQKEKKKSNKMSKSNNSNSDSSNSDSSSIKNSSNDNNNEKIINFIEESETEGKSEIEKENDQIMQALRKINNVSAIIKDESESEENILTDMETDINEEVYNYPEENLVDLNSGEIIKNNNKLPKHIPIGQQAEFREFIGSMSQGVNLNGYFLDLDNVYEEQELNKRITDWNLGTYIALMSSPQIG